MKWKKFAFSFVEFFAHAFDHNGVLDELFSISKLFNYEEFASYYLEQPNQLIRFMRKHPRLHIPMKIFFDERFCRMAHDINVESFYFYMGFIW